MTVLHLTVVTFIDIPGSYEPYDRYYLFFPSIGAESCMLFNYVITMSRPYRFWLFMTPGILER